MGPLAAVFRGGAAYYATVRVPRSSWGCRVRCTMLHFLVALMRGARAAIKAARV